MRVVDGVMGGWRVALMRISHAQHSEMYWRDDLAVLRELGTIQFAAFYAVYTVVYIMCVLYMAQHDNKRSGQINVCLHIQLAVTFVCTHTFLEKSFIIASHNTMNFRSSYILNIGADERVPKGR